MIASGIRKFARERGMVCDGGFAYGKLSGRHISLDEGSGYKALQVYLYHPAEQLDDGGARDDAILAALTDCDLKEFRLDRSGAVGIHNGVARLVFFDTIGTMGRIVRYIDEILPKLDALNLDADRCAHCGEALNGDVDYVQLDGCILPVHGACVRQLSALVDSVDEQSRSGGSMARGALGAALGALIGAIAYALVFAAGYIAGLVGLVMGLLSSRLYDKFGGRKSKWKLLVVAVLLVLGILLGQVAGYTLMFNSWYNESGFTEEEYPRMHYVAEYWEEFIFDQETALGIQYERLMADVPQAERESGLYMTRQEFIDTYYSRDVDEYRAAMADEFARNYALGLFYGLLGCLGVFMQIHRQNRRRRVRDVK